MEDRTQEIEVREHFFEDDGRIPNNPELPLLVYPGVLGESDLSPSRCKELLVENGWGGAWVNGVFSYHHYHSNAHEVLCVVSGEACIAFSGPEGTTVEAGDARRDPGGRGALQRGVEQRLLGRRRISAGPRVLRPAYRRRYTGRRETGLKPKDS